MYIVNVLNIACTMATRVYNLCKNGYIEKSISYNTYIYFELF